jgi:hypothetical protein
MKDKSSMVVEIDAGVGSGFFVGRLVATTWKWW